MKKVMVFNFKTMQYEEATSEEGKELLSLIDAMNADCANQQSVKPTNGTQGGQRGNGKSGSKKSEQS